MHVSTFTYVEIGWATNPLFGFSQVVNGNKYSVRDIPYGHINGIDRSFPTMYGSVEGADECFRLVKS